jgi:voltage-gated potassium channel
MIKRVRSHHSFMMGYLWDLLKALFRPAMVFLFFLSFSVILLSAAGIYYFEMDQNDKIVFFMDAVYYIVTIFTGVGLGDIVPLTNEGRIVSMLVMFIGTAIYVSLAGVVAATVLSLERERER